MLAARRNAELRLGSRRAQQGHLLLLGLAAPLLSIPLAAGSARSLLPLGQLGLLSGRLHAPLGASLLQCLPLLGQALGVILQAAVLRCVHE